MATMSNFAVAPQEWSAHTEQGFREWQMALLDHGRGSREARWAHGRFLDRMVNDTADADTRRRLARRAWELLES